MGKVGKGLMAMCYVAVVIGLGSIFIALLEHSTL